MPSGSQQLPPFQLSPYLGHLAHVDVPFYVIVYNFAVASALIFCFRGITKLPLFSELPHLVRTVQKSPLVGNIKFLGGEAPCKRRLSSL